MSSWFRSSWVVADINGPNFGNRSTIAMHCQAIAIVVRGFRRHVISRRTPNNISVWVTNFKHCFATSVSIPHSHNVSTRWKNFRDVIPRQINISSIFKPVLFYLVLIDVMHIPPVFVQSRCRSRKSNKVGPEFTSGSKSCPSVAGFQCICRSENTEKKPEARNVHTPHLKQGEKLKIASLN